MSARPRTAAQNAAVTRNWRIRNLRALSALARQLRPDRACAVRVIVDEELIAMGAESELGRMARQHAQEAAERSLEDLIPEIPF